VVDERVHDVITESWRIAFFASCRARAASCPAVRGTFKAITEAAEPLNRGRSVTELGRRLPSSFFANRRAALLAEMMRPVDPCGGRNSAMLFFQAVSQVCLLVRTTRGPTTRTW
jgi:hypothetical protein